jgi:predicted Zn-dependent peptidase
VIIEEILKYEDQPPFGAHEKCMAAYFQQHPLGNNILGTTASVGQLTSQAMREYFRRRYSPGNIKLVAAGHLDFEALVRDAERLCGDWEVVSTQRQTPPVVPHTGVQLITKETATQQYVIQIAAGPGAEDQTRHAGRILAAIVGDDSGSRLYWELVDTGLAEYAGVGAYEFQNAGIFMSYLCCAPQRAADNLQRVAGIFQQLERAGITADELELAKNKICSQLVRQSERPGNRLFSVGNGWLQRRSYQTVQERLAAYQEVDLEAIHRLLQQYPLSRNTTVAVGPLGQLV